MTDTAPATSPNLVRFGRRSSRGLLLGFSAARVACIAAAAAVFIPSLLIAGIVGTAATAVVWVSLLAAAFVPWAGRPLIETAPTAAHFLVRRLQRQTTYAVRPSEPRPAGTLALPGDAAALRWLWHPGTGAVMVHDPHEQTLTAVAHVSHPAYVLLSPDEQSRRVQGWGRALAGLAASGTCARVQILESAQPDSGRGIIDWWQEHREPRRRAMGCAAVRGAHGDQGPRGLHPSHPDRLVPGSEGGRQGDQGRRARHDRLSGRAGPGHGRVRVRAPRR